MCYVVWKKRNSVQYNKLFLCHCSCKTMKNQCCKMLIVMKQTTASQQFKKHLMTLTSHSSLSILLNSYTVISPCLPFSSNQIFLTEICKDWTFLYIPWSVQVMKPLRHLKQTELMCCNYAPLLWLLWRYMQALVSATSAGSHRPLFFQDQWACPCWVLGGHRSMSKTSWVFGLTPLSQPLLRFCTAIHTLPRSLD